MNDRKAPSFKNVHIAGFKTGISMPANTPAEFDGLTIEGCETAIDLRDPPSFLSQLGLPVSTPPESLLEALEILNGPAVETVKAKEARLNSSRLFEWLGASANLSTVAQSLVSLSQSRVYKDSLEFLKDVVAP